MRTVKTRRSLSRFCFGTLVLLFAALVGAAHAEESTFKTLLMPGKLIAGHAKLEKDCAQCHVSFEKQAQDKLCVQCHDVIAADIDKRKGFHGRIDRNTALACKQCHTDHKGRDADIVGLDRDNFDHALTDFPLEGKHAGLRCVSCHKPGKKFREASTACYGCHKAADRHRGVLGRQCESCHTPQAWRQTKFDHSTTKFQLNGKHRQVSCGACHPAERYRYTPKTCVACHAINDVHRGGNGKDCQRCHSEENWKKSTFNHDRDTHFALRGAHADAACNSCHRAGKFEIRLETACVACHRSDDVHKGKNGERCDSCHNESRWSKQTFDHNRNTKFTLRGKHVEVACNACHRGNVHDALPRDCVGCHRLDDVHKGQQGDRCDSCHSESGWKQQLAFDHTKTKFPLTGLHAVVPCEGCHASTAFKGAPQQCVACHKAVDKHRGTLGSRCDTCHSTKGWKHWRFDHDKQTKFPLTGAHAQLTCGDCHRESTGDRVQQARSCYSCHAADDEHDGRFGRYCERCHNTTDFKQVEMLR